MSDEHVSFEVEELGRRHLEDIARVHRAAFKRSALTYLGHRAVRRYYDWQMHGPHLSFALGCVVDQRLTAFCIGGTFSGSLSGFLRGNRTFLIACTVSRPWLWANPVIRDRVSVALRRKFRFSRQKRPPESGLPPSFGILAIATDPAYEGHGIGTALMEVMEGMARSHGFRHMHLTVEPTNQRAIGFYRALGWSRDETKPNLMTKVL